MYEFANGNRYVVKKSLTGFITSIILGLILMAIGFIYAESMRTVLVVAGFLFIGVSIRELISRNLVVVDSQGLNVGGITYKWEDIAWAKVEMSMLRNTSRQFFIFQKKNGEVKTVDITTCENVNEFISIVNQFAATNLINMQECQANQMNFNIKRLRILLLVFVLGFALFLVRHFFRYISH